MPSNLQTGDVWWAKELVRISRIANEVILRHLSDRALAEVSKAADTLTWLIVSETLRRNDNDNWEGQPQSTD